MIQVTPQTRVFVAIEPIDFRAGIDALARVCRAQLAKDPFSGALFVFRNPRQTAVKVLGYDGQGFFVFHKRLSVGKFKYWPTSSGEATRLLRGLELAVLLASGNPAVLDAAADWRPVR